MFGSICDWRRARVEPDHLQRREMFHIEILKIEVFGISYIYCQQMSKRYWVLRLFREMIADLGFGLFSTYPYTCKRLFLL